MIPLEDYISGGYLVTQYIYENINSWLKTNYGATEDLLPEKIVSVGFCGAIVTNVFDWIGYYDEQYTDYGISLDRVSEIGEWANPQFDIEIGYPNIFFTLATAQTFVQRFTDQRSDIQIIGIGFHKEHLSQIDKLKQLHPRIERQGRATIAGFESTGFAQVLERDEPYLPGEIVGFDVICCDYNIDHSWHCNGLAVDALQKFNFRPNQFGLIDDKTNADQLAAYADELQPEPGVWIPVLVSRYPLMP